jgi:hypothetical protein
MRRLALTIVLACVLSGVARAGEIHTTGAVSPSPSPPPPPTMMTTGEIHSTGEIPSTGEIAPEASSMVLTMILTLISIVR